MSEFGGQWHVVKLGPTDNDYYSVYYTWFKRHDGKSIYKSGVVDNHKFPRKKNVARRVITSFNKFLLWLFKKWINARANNRKT